MRLAPALLLTSLTGCSLLVDLGGLAGSNAGDAGSGRDGSVAGEAGAQQDAGPPKGNDASVDAAPFGCDRTSAFCDGFDDRGDAGVQRGWPAQQTRGGGALTIFSPGLASPGALRAEIPATGTGADVGASLSQVLAATGRLTLDFDLFVESFPSTGELAVANLSIRSDTSSATIDFYMAASGVGLYNALGDASSSADAAFTPALGAWTHVHEEVSIPDNRMLLVFDGRSDRTITVNRDLSSIKPKSGFLLIGLNHYAGQQPVGAARIRIDNVLVNAPAL